MPHLSLSPTPLSTRSSSAACLAALLLTTAVGGTREFEDRSSAVDGGVSLTLLSSGVDARFDEQAAHFYEQGTRIDTRFDEQAARMDVINARFDSLQADNTRLQAQLHVQNAKLDALLSSATAAHSPPAK